MPKEGIEPSFPEEHDFESCALCLFRHFGFMSAPKYTTLNTKVKKIMWSGMASR